MRPVNAKITWMRNFDTNGPHKGAWNGKRSRDPAVSIDDMNWNIIVIDTLNGVSNVLHI